MITQEGDIMTPTRHRLPDTRRSVTCKREICGFEVYIHVGFYDDGTEQSDATACQPGELFVKVAKHGTEMSGVIDAFAIMVSLALQYGVPWEKIKDKMIDMRFGIDDGQNSSLIDGIVRCVDQQITARIALLA